MSHSLRHLGDDRWQCAVYLGRDENGAQRRKTRTFRARSKREATSKGHQVEADLRAELDRVVVTVAQAAEDWWPRWLERERSPSTVESYRIILDRHILAGPLAGVPVEDVTTAAVERWYGQLRSGDDGLSPARIRRIHAVLTQVFKQCVRARQLVVNPAADAWKPAGNAKRRQFVAPEVVAQILAAAHDIDPTHARVLAVAGRTGLRRGELAGLRWSRIVAAERAILVERSVIEVAGKHIARKDARWPANSKGAQWPDGRWLVEKDTKAHNVEPVLLSAGDVALLTQQAQWQQTEAEKAGVKLAADPFLFAVTPPFDRPIHPDTLTRWHLQACEAAGVTGVRLHDLRHHHASVYLAAGATLEETRQRLRHKSIQTTMGYLEADRSKQSELVDLTPRWELGS